MITVFNVQLNHVLSQVSMAMQVKSGIFEGRICFGELEVGLGLSLTGSFNWFTLSLGCGFSCNNVFLQQGRANSNFLPWEFEYSEGLMFLEFTGDYYNTCRPWPFKTAQTLLFLRPRPLYDVSKMFQLYDERFS